MQEVNAMFAVSRCTHPTFLPYLLPRFGFVVVLDYLWFRCFCCIDFPRHVHKMIEILLICSFEQTVASRWLAELAE